MVSVVTAHGEQNGGMLTPLAQSGKYVDRYRQKSI